jgi:hypothetical protein
MAIDGATIAAFEARAAEAEARLAALEAAVASGEQPRAPRLQSRLICSAHSPAPWPGTASHPHPTRPAAHAQAAGRAPLLWGP